MKLFRYRFIPLLLILFLLSCQRRQDQSLQLAIYQPLASTQMMLLHEDFFPTIEEYGFNAILLSSQHFSKGTIEVAIKSAHQANLEVLLELQNTASLEQDVAHWILENQVDGFIINTTDAFSESDRRRLHYAIAKNARILEKKKSAWGTAGYLIGRSQQENEAAFIKATFGENGNRRALQTFLNSAGQPLLELALSPQEDAANRLATYHSLRRLYGSRAQAVALTPIRIASNATRSAILLDYITSSPQSFIYTGMLAPMDDTFLATYMPSFMQRRVDNPLLQQANTHVLRGFDNLYVDVISHRSQQILRIINFNPAPTIFTLGNNQNIVRGRVLIDISTGEEISFQSRSIRIPLEGNSLRLLKVQ
ncbi:alpha-amylase family protein [Entomospira entomophila]|uniref:Lipoprotein n=1 Tax=Entomospira entomophila TaxID=2719988 RepID=A0A968GB67_9SPIO|nr:alpha-amylase family protein [Entomospira entomophilus]NIZ40418.1 hypothetical protein [Entomospira entomophilus]WDI35976.1 alpha-amylase family protein [Entomospira entomophilus]